MAKSEDQFELVRFVRAQEPDYERAVAELCAGHKRTHWMWYVFPQFDGLGRSPRSVEFAIKSRAEACAYLAHPILGPRLLECCEVIVGLENGLITEIFSEPDDLKFHSCVTLFAQVSSLTLFQRVLDKFFDGKADERTLQLLSLCNESNK